MKRAILAWVLVLGWLSPCHAQVAHVATNAPKDKPISADAVSFDRMLKPYMEMALASYPQAKARFQKGLTPGESFFVCARLYDKTGNFEQVFVAVRDIAAGRVKGRIASDVEHIAGYKRGDSFECPEKDIFDWVITKPDGSEEGNFVGKVLDAVQERRIPLIVQMVVGENGKVRSTKFESALNHSKQDISYSIPASVRNDAEQIVKQFEYAPTELVKTNYTYLIYDFHEQRIEKPERGQQSGGHVR
jgi:hypothetical protein